MRQRVLRCYMGGWHWSGILFADFNKAWRLDWRTIGKDTRSSVVKCAQRGVSDLFVLHIPSKDVENRQLR